MLLVITAITILSLIPDPPVPKHPVYGLDKIEHVLAYAALGFFLLPVIAGRKTRKGTSFFLVLFLSLFYGGCIEYFQEYVGRNREVLDLAADLFGTALGAGTFWFLDKRYFSR